MRFKQLLLLSRPRFWLYLAGPYAIGSIAAAKLGTDLLAGTFIYPLFYFLIPANIFLYGINDVFDIQTDILNPKKHKQEQKLIKDQSRRTHQIVVIITIGATIPLIFIFDPIEKLILCLFLFLAYFYSAQPLRFKTIPYIDSLSNILYIIPAIVGYHQLAGGFPPILVLILCVFWTTAMHLFSAIPDIHYDRAAGITTTATRLGRYHSLVICMVLWSLVAVGSILYSPLFAISFVYPVLPFLLLVKKELRTIKVYWWFPYINGVLGALLFWYFAWRLL